ncbi:MAG: hypothetical protein ACRDOK_18285 [Streptosporangiaceae bacterium]
MRDCQPGERVGGFVVAVRDSESFNVPGQLVCYARDACIEDAPVGQAGQVGVAAVVGPQVTDPNPARLPDAREPVVKVVTDGPGSVDSAQQVGPAQFVAGSLGEAFPCAVGSDDIPCDGPVGPGLDWDKQPVVGVGDAQVNGLVTGLAASAGLGGLLGGQV